MKKILVFVLVVAFGVAVYRRLSSSRGPAATVRAQRGTPDHWPPVVRKPGSTPASATSAA